MSLTGINIHSNKGETQVYYTKSACLPFHQHSLTFKYGELFFQRSKKWPPQYGSPFFSWFLLQWLLLITLPEKQNHNRDDLHLKMKQQGIELIPDKPNWLPIKLKKIHLIIIAFIFVQWLYKTITTGIKKPRKYVYLPKIILVLSSWLLLTYWISKWYNLYVNAFNGPILAPFRMFVLSKDWEKVHACTELQWKASWSVF